MAEVASRDNPLVVSRNQIDHFERKNPALAGISTIMLDMGIWVIAKENSDAKSETASARGGTIASDKQQHGVATNVYGNIFAR